jgi:rubrerythrin
MVVKVIYRCAGLSANYIRGGGGGGGGGDGMVKVRCHKCGYEWEYKGKLGLATCPNCGAKAKVPRETRG